MLRDHYNICVEMHFNLVEVVLQGDTGGVPLSQIQCGLQKLIASSAPCGGPTHLAMTLASEERAKISRNVGDVTDQAPLMDDGAC